MRPNRREFVVAGASAGVVAVGSVTGAEPAKPAASSAAGIPFQLGMVTYNVAAQWDLATTLKICKSVGIAAVECRTTHKHGVEPSLTKDQRADVKKQFADSGVAFWGAGSTCEFHAPDETVVKKNIELCKTFIDLVAEIGGKGVKVRPNGLPKGVPVEKTLAQIGKALKECGTAAESAGIEICVEVHGPGTQEPANAKTIMEETAHKSVGLTWNSNPTDVKAGSVKESFDMLKPWIKSCHINEIYKDAAKIYPYRELFSLLRSIGYNRYTMIEVGRTPTDPASGEDMLRYYKALWTELARG
ncbi:sugar phosphate isomerase/epimerase family protein [Zavarzinella formosa]|uniref:sugar phosphate isomerase/epimerase family protein n=1 Tax=Zavarzinella formosa TaxID=360055 RepID=UPI000317D71C|nr:TIM barrel protein [Zavarzinella formosa]